MTASQLLGRYKERTCAQQIKRYQAAGRDLDTHAMTRHDLTPKPDALDFLGHKCTSLIRRTLLVLY